MKKIFFFLLFISVCVTSYYDITKGTLHNQAKNPKKVSALPASGKVKPPTESGKKKPVKQVKVAPGDTVLSIVEKLNPNTHIAITKVLQDFEKLNPKTDPNHIQIGKVYQFPIYK